MTVHYLPAAGERDDPSADEIARELVFLAGPDDPMLLPDDDAFDLCAVELAECGTRQVRLTLAERLTAATRLLSSGVTVRSVCLRLGLPEDTERKWYQLRRRAVAIISVLAIIVATGWAIASVFRTEPVRHRAHHTASVIHRPGKGRKYLDDRGQDDRI